MRINDNNAEIGEHKEEYRDAKSRKAPLRVSSLARKLLIRGENRREFEEFRENIHAELVPKTKVENILCEKFIASAWKLRRAMVVEKTLLDRQNSITDEEKYGFGDELGYGTRRRIRNIKKVDLGTENVRHLIHYQLELEKAMQKALERLREEQRLRNQYGASSAGNK